MNVQGLGDLDTPVLLFGGPYSNLQATRALRAEAARLEIAPDHVICTGDVVAYCADSAATVAEIRDWGCVVVAGNCEKQLATDALDCGCGFEEGTVCDLLSAAWYAHANAQVGADDRRWMGRCPDIVTFAQAGRRFAVIHGGLSDVSRFLWPTSPDAAFQQEIDLITSSVGPVHGVIAGHCGLAFTRRIGGVDWINAGVIGMPPNDGRPQTRFAVLEGGQAHTHMLDYDAQAARVAMEQAGLVQGYHTGLTGGYWPSEEVLPPELRGAALASG